MLRVDVSKQLGEFSLSADFTSDGRVTGLFGASGAGKTSLINMIAGLLRPDRGVIALDGEIHLERRRPFAVTPIRPLDPAGHGVAVDRQHLDGAEVEHDDVGCRDVAAARDGHAGGDASAVRL